MKPYMKSTTNQEELFKIIASLEMLEMQYRITTTHNYVDGSWTRCWNIDELEVTP